MDNDLEEELTCPICLEILRTPIQILSPCGHRACDYCIRSWFQYQKLHRKERTCILCREICHELIADNDGEEVVRMFYERNPEFHNPGPCPLWTGGNVFDNFPPLGTHNSLTQFPRNYRMNRSNSHSGAFVFRPVSPGSHPFRALITTRSNTSERSPVRGRLRNPSSRNRHPVSGVQELASGYQEEPHPSGTLFRPQGGSESQPRHSGIFVNFRRENQTMPRFLEPPLISQEVSEALPRDPFVSLSHFPHRPQITGPGTGSQSQHVYQRQGSINTEESRYHLLCPGSNNGNREFAQSLSLVRRPSPESDEPQSFVNTLAPSQEPQCSLAFPKPSLGSSHGRNIQLTSSGPSANFLPRILSIQRPPGPIPWLANDAQPRALSPRPPNFVSWIIEQSHPLIPLQIHETVESLDRFTQAASGSTIRPRPVTIRQDSIERDHNHVLASSSVLSRGIRRSGSAFELVSGSHLPQLCSSRPVP